ncbi:MAG: small basic protein [Candidatus Omnitrophica bacterium]|nr:small basic protein [Candidatus Omnitrophota bacterium]
MGIHPSLKTSDKVNKARSVMKRSERIRSMIEKGQWKEGDDVYGLPKIKAVRIKIKKEKVEKAADAVAGADGAAAPAAGVAKEVAPAKGAAKAADKK